MLVDLDVSHVLKGPKDQNWFASTGVFGCEGDCPNIMFIHEGLWRSLSQEDGQGFGADGLLGLDEVTALCQIAYCYARGLCFNCRKGNLLHHIVIRISKARVSEDKLFRIQGDVGWSCLVVRLLLLLPLGIGNMCTKSGSRSCCHVLGEFVR